MVRHAGSGCVGSGTIKPPAELKTKSEMLEAFDELTGVVKLSLSKLDDESLVRMWTLQRGENIMHRRRELRSCDFGA